MGETKWVTHRHDRGAHGHTVGLCKDRGAQVAWWVLDLDDREVGCGVEAGDLCIVDATVIKRHLNCVVGGTLDNVVVRDDVALGVDDDARALCRALLRVHANRNHRGCDCRRDLLPVRVLVGGACHGHVDSALARPAESRRSLGGG